MNIKNIVKVMNFHSLLRVERSRKSAKTYAYLGDAVADMIDNIVNNRNIMLDYKINKVNTEAPELSIYLGGDMGFCANLNSNVTKQVLEDEDHYKIIVGRKIRPAKGDDKVLMTMTQEEFEKDKSRIFDVLEEAFREKKYSKINLVYNHYYSASETEFCKRQLYPLPKHLRSENSYDEDFTFESSIEPLLMKLMILYMQYELIIAGEISSAALNITRQNTTTESLKKIDESEENQHMLELRNQREKEFGKVLDNYTKLKRY